LHEISVVLGSPLFGSDLFTSDLFTSGRPLHFTARTRSRNFSADFKRRGIDLVDILGGGERGGEHDLIGICERASRNFILPHP
jgi:hypothetical protein